MSLHEHFRDDEPVEAASNRAFGCIVGTITIAIAAGKTMLAAALTPVSLLLFAAGVGLLALGIGAPSLLTPAKRLWLRLGAVMAKVVNPIILALMFYLAVTPLAWLMRLAGKRPLRLAADRAAASYWIPRDRNGDGSDMRRQF